MTPERLRSIFPPRAEVAIRPATLDRYRGYFAQFKYNDIRTLILFYPGPEGKSTIELRTRKREPHRLYRLSSAMDRSLRALKLRSGTEHVLDGGIFRTLFVRPGPRRGTRERPIVLWDILVHEGRPLLGMRAWERYELLREICGNPARPEKLTGQEVGLEITPVLWLAPVFFSKEHEFGKIFAKSLEPDYLEGLILKDPHARLEPGLREMNNTRWQFKIRKPRADYTY